MGDGNGVRVQEGVGRRLIVFWLGFELAISCFVSIGYLFSVRE